MTTAGSPCLERHVPRSEAEARVARALKIAHRALMESAGCVTDGLKSHVLENAIKAIKFNLEGPPLPLREHAPEELVRRIHSAMTHALEAYHAAAARYEEDDDGSAYSIASAALKQTIRLLDAGDTQAQQDLAESEKAKPQKEIV